MKRVLLALVLALSFAAPALAQPTVNLAPADRYFGRLKMSILGVRNSLKDLAARADAHPEDAEHIYDKAVLVEDALRDWHAPLPARSLDPEIRLQPRAALRQARLRRRASAPERHAGLADRDVSGV